MKVAAMTLDEPKRRNRIRFGHPSRMAPETREITLLIVGHFMLFALAMSHDEIVAELVADGWILARYGERFELLIGLVLFLCWSGLTLRLAGIINHARVEK